ncbi:unnamed protein product [Cyprideis torosa]|uniref:Ribonuclease H2 subunit B n=1 Tax=Cyprideis torosa TaxID=163714 RepID=A0A7R8WN08_9CRUS|nr:unnamed protein product [Cyprideis torosa]CAG0899874.1 unnamed protein product [Cyprideis torosa]
MEKSFLEGKQIREMKNNAKQHVAILNESLLYEKKERDFACTVVKLRHPRTREAALYAKTPRNGIVGELHFYAQPHRSWFLNESINSDGRLLFITPIDPIFLLLPYVIHANKSSSSFVPKEQLVMEDREFPETISLFNSLKGKGLENIAEKKETGDVTAYRYSEDLAVDWLERKVQVLLPILKAKGVNTTASRIASFKPRSTVDGDAEPMSLLRESYGIVSSYLPDCPRLKRALSDRLGLPFPSDSRAATENNCSPSPKKTKELVKPSEDYATEQFKKKETSATTPAQARLAKAAKGSKSISSFFGNAASKKK